MTELSSFITFFVEHISDARNRNFGITNAFTTWLLPYNIKFRHFHPARVSESDLSFIIVELLFFLQIVSKMNPKNFNWFINFVKANEKGLVSIEVLHGSHVAWQEQKIPFAMGKEVLLYAKYSHCSCHATWLPCKTSIVASS